MSAPRRPVVSVIIPTCDGASTIGATLRSLGRQTLPHDRFEIIVVRNGPSDTTAEVVAETRREFPDLIIRGMAYRVPGAGRARNAGLAMAQGDYVTFVDDDDTVSTEYLQALLLCSGPETVGVAQMADVTGPGAAPDFSAKNRVSQLTGAGSTLTAGEAIVALSYSVGKMMPAALARYIGFDPDLRSGEDIVFYMCMFSEFHLNLRLCPLEAHAVYYRAVVPNSVSRRSPSYDFSVSQRLDVIERLESLRPATLWERRARAHMISGQTHFINRYLRVERDKHSAVIDEIRRRGLTSIPYRRLNRHVARDLAILYAALPFADTSANVAARRIRAAGVLVDVISADLSAVRSVDTTADRIWREFVDESFRIQAKHTLRGNWARISPFCLLGMKRIQEQEKAKGRYRSVYSRAMFPGSHVLAAWCKVRNPGMKWVAEFSDPQLYDIHGDMRPSKGRPDPVMMAELRRGFEAAGFTPPEDVNVWEWAEVLPYALADTILFTNEHQRSYMLGHCHDKALVARAMAHSLIEPHPRPPVELYQATEPVYELDPALVHVAYFGKFYQTRGLTEVLSALRLLAPAQRARLRVHVFTSKPDVLEAEVDRLGLGDVMVVNASVGYLDCLNLTTRFDALLVNDARTADSHTVNPYLPSKYSDYSGSGRKVWGIVEPGSVLSTCPLDYRSELGDIEGATAVLDRLVSGHTP